MLTCDHLVRFPVVYAWPPGPTHVESKCGLCHSVWPDTVIRLWLLFQENGNHMCFFPFEPVSFPWSLSRFCISLVILQDSLVAQTVKNLPAMRVTWVQFLGWEDPLEKGMAIHSSILALRIPWTEEPGGYSPWIAKSQTWLHSYHHHPVFLQVYLRVEDVKA